MDRGQTRVTGGRHYAESEVRERHKGRENGPGTLRRGTGEGTEHSSHLGREHVGRQLSRDLKSEDRHAEKVGGSGDLTHRLKDCVLCTVALTRDHTSSPNQASSQIVDNVPIEIGHH